ncbi:hypothetical protein L1987_88332 [Smallanthus sonchifolius]|nr:hypothetical protein L1987_88332 [Smallanthus sonchifolius]
MEHLLYWSSALSRSSLSRIGVHDPSRLLLVESIKKACDQCSDQFSITADEYDKMIDQIYAGQPGDMIVVAPDPKDIVVIIALTELLFDLCIYQKYTEEERVKSKTDEYKHLNRYHSNLIDMGCLDRLYRIEIKYPFPNGLILHSIMDIVGEDGLVYKLIESFLNLSYIDKDGNDVSYFIGDATTRKTSKSDGQIECIGQFGVSVDIDTKNLIFHHQFDTRFPSTSRAFPSLSQSAGEGSSRAPLTNVFSFSRLGRGLRGVVNENYEKIVVEILTFYKGKYGRLIILVSLGVSTTIWIGIINSTSAVPGAAERDALAVEAKKGIEVRLA